MRPNSEISVALCTYNGEKFLAEQLQSIASQTVLPTELVVCDDCSTDSTLKVVNEFAAVVPFEVRVFQNPKNIGSTKRGITGNFEKAMGLCRERLIAFCDQDDFWEPRKLERLSEVLNNNPQYAGAFSDADLIDRQSVLTGVRLWNTTGFDRIEQQRMLRGDELRVLLGLNKVFGCTLMFNASLMDKLLPIPPHWTHDNWVACMAALQARLAFVPEPLIRYRIHPSQFYGAAVPSLGARIRQWKIPARQYLREAEPQLLELYERACQNPSPEIEPRLRYLEGRLRLVRLRAGLPANRMRRLAKVLPEIANYHRYLNGWRTIVKDITA